MWKIILGIWFFLGLIGAIFDNGGNSGSGSLAKDNDYSIKKVEGTKGTSIKTNVGNLNAHESKSSVDGYNGIKD